jgi:hypothetical protein
MLMAKQTASYGMGHCLQSKLFVSPFVARKGFANNEDQGLLAGFAYEFRWELSTADFSRVKHIEARIMTPSSQ